ncbi:type I-E CRISPR-associated protein Cse1/CasA [Sessilibacter corallicola]|uniref:Type I-E CRISPR-associated protein Cse1/CasA n=1 Tax=Sessilibacter corallicola TaxID=2904075 RepID=A0ABQ0ACV4_9GAMM
MNLITTPWLNVIRANGDLDVIAPAQLVETDNPVLDLNSCRPDFKGGLYQLLIGLFQTFFAPKDNDDWSQWYESPPPIDDVNKAFANYIDYFELFSGKIAFLQDFDLPEAETKSVSALLIEAPGAKTIKDNLDHFVKRNQVNAICPECLSSALYTLQTNAPSGGAGHRTGMRGGGPLTTLLMPHDPKATLWQKIWLNILTASNEPDDYSDVFPWLKPTKTSEKKDTGTVITEVHPLQMHWGMPRRIRVNLDSMHEGNCDLCGKHSQQLISEYRTKNYGINYDGEWIHPLTPHREDPKGKKPTLSIKGQPGGVGYRDWLTLNFTYKNGDTLPAKVVNVFYSDERLELLKEEYPDIAKSFGLWCFGYDMDNMKARCWYENQMPVVGINTSLIYADKSSFIDLVEAYVKKAQFVLKALKDALKQANSDVKFVDDQFWLATEDVFFDQIIEVSKYDELANNIPEAVFVRWIYTLRNTAFSIFDHKSLDYPVDEKNLKNIAAGRASLTKKLGNKKIMDDFNSYILNEEGDS